MLKNYFCALNLQLFWYENVHFGFSSSVGDDYHP